MDFEREHMSAAGARGRKGAAALIGVGTLCAAAALAGLPLWLCAAPLLGVATVLLALLYRSTSGTPRRSVAADDRATRDAALRRLQPLAPRAATPVQPLAARPMLWERPTPRV
jgi:hypothetical protein